jgi:dephospho-CoA kinase
MKIVGLTGGIGSGKTTVLKMFQNLGVVCYIADIEAKRLMITSEKIKIRLIEEFGEESFTDKGLNRSFLAEIIFSDPEKLKMINSIIHPEVHKDFAEFVKMSKGEYVIYESAILFESKSEASCDSIITVTAPIDIRIERIINRDGISKSDILLRMNNQLSEEIKMERSDYVIENIDLQDTKCQVLTVHNTLLSK